MIIDLIKNCEKYYSIHPRFKEVFEFILKTDFSKIDCGRYEIEGDNIYVNIEEYKTKDVSKPEYHKKYIDIQLVASGKEMVGYLPKSDLIIDDGYDEKKDLGFGQGVPDFINIKPGLFLIFFPDDVHQPCMMVGESKKVKKVVVKVKVDA